MEFVVVRMLLFALWGLVVGLMVGFTAIGTGLMGTPGLMILFGVPPVTAVGTMGFAGVVLMTSSVLQHFREGNVEKRVAVIFSVTAIPTAFGCAHFADAINEVIPLRMIIGTIIIVSTVLLFYRNFVMKEKERKLEMPRWKLIASPFLGIGLGALMGATSISGSIIVIVFLLVLKLPTPLAVGTTCGVAAVSLAVAAVAHILAGNIDWAVVIGLVPGVILGGTIGSRYVKRVPRRLLQYAILIVLVIAGLAVLVKGGDDDGEVPEDSVVRAEEAAR